MTSVLIVEDDTDLLQELDDYLSSVGYIVTGACSVAEAKKALANSFDLLVLDINLPDGSGLELCQQLRPYIRSGIVMCTGRSERELRIQSLKDGADAYLVKPVDPEELDATLGSVHRRVVGPGKSMLRPSLLPVQWRLDCTRQLLTGPNGKATELSQAEVLLLFCIFDRANGHTTRLQLISTFEAAGIPLDGRRLETLASRLRGKVNEKLGVKFPLRSVYGKGYSFSDYTEVISG